MTRAVTFAVLLASIAAGVAGGTAFALAVVEEPNTSGAFLTFLASWCVAVLCFSLGLLLSQFVSRPKLSSGIAATAILALYVLGNSAETFGSFSFLQYLSPFTYSNLSRVLVPGMNAHWPSMVGVLLVATFFLVLAAFLFGQRDVGDVMFHRRARAAHRRARSSRITVRTLFADGLYHGWASIVGWASGTTILIALMISLEPAAIEAWSYFDVLLPPSPDASTEREAQYLAFSGTLMVPLIAGYVVAQSAKWSADFSAGRTAMIMSTPVRWIRVFGIRVLVTLLGVLAIIVTSEIALVTVAQSVGVDIEVEGLLRLTAMSLALGLAMIAFCSIVTNVFRQRSSVLVLSVYLASAYLLIYIVPMLEWPEWVGRLSIFTAFGTPYLEWPPVLDALAILILAGPGLVLAYLLSNRSRKTP